MKKATLTREDNKHYYLEIDDDKTVDLGPRKPSVKRQKDACQPALGEEVIIRDRTE